MLARFRYPFAAGLLAALVAGWVVRSTLPDDRSADLVSWASTSVANLVDHPISALLASAPLGVLSPVGALAAAWSLFAADAVFGWRRALPLVLLAHLTGTGVSEGVVWWRVAHGDLGESALRQTDVGASYLVVGACVAVALHGGGPARQISALAASAAAPFLLAGITRLDVAPVGHLVAAATAAAVGYWVRPSRTRPTRRWSVDERRWGPATSPLYGRWRIPDGPAPYGAGPSGSSGRQEVSPSASASQVSNSADSSRSLAS